MEDSRDVIEEVELIDYLRVIWKRKWLIFVITLLTIVGTGIMSIRMPKIYQADALIEIGKVIAIPTTTATTPTTTPVTSPKEMVEYLSFKYGSGPLIVNGREEEGSLKAQVVEGTNLVRVTMEGPGQEKIKEILKRVIDDLIEDHFERTRASIQTYSAYIERLEADVRKIQREIKPAEEKIEKINPDKEYLPLIIMAQNYLLNRKDALRKLKQDILFYRSLTRDLERYKTKLIGEIKAKKNPVKPKVGRNILLGGTVSLLFSIFLAFFVEYVEKAMIRERKELKD